MKSWLLVLLTLGTLAATIGVAWHQRGTHRRTQSELAATQARVRALTGAEQTLLTQIATSEAAARELRVSAESVVAKVAAEKAKAAKSAAPAPRPPHSLDVLQKDPEVLAFSLAARRAELRAEYGVLFRQLGLSPEQVARFEANVIRLEERRTDVHATKLSRGLSDSDPAIRELGREIDAEYEKAQRELLGPAGMTRLEEYRSTIQVRKIVGGLAGAAVLAGVPWSPQQAEAVVQATASVAQEGSTKPLTPWVNPGALDWDKVDERVRQILTPRQFELFRSVQPGGGGAGARYQWLLNQSIDQAVTADAAAASRGG